MINNKLKKKLKNGETALGTFIMCNSPDLVEVVGLSGLDFVVIDTEHGPLSLESTQHLIRAAELRGMSSIIRITEFRDTTVLRALDVGAHGVQVPQVNDRITAERIVKAAKYFPLGTRGAALTRAADYGTVHPLKYFEHENEETLIVVHCESKSSLDNLEEIAAIPGIDVIFLGPFDMSQSLGIPAQVTHPLVEQAAEKVVKVANDAGIAAGIFVRSGDQVKIRVEQGFRYITIGTDVGIIGAAYRREISNANSN
ncbi:MAG: aldolase [Dethiobacter sp.]|jgi:4-hydroxy-2-oxoheptanedioate aldolase|nr:aldolase [Dethiobacter sp.]